MIMVEKIDLRTDKERMRDELHKQICDEYIALSQQQPTAKPYRIFNAIGEKFGFTKIGVAKIVQRGGLYTPATAK